MVKDIELSEKKDWELDRMLTQLTQEINSHLSDPITMGEDTLKALKVKKGQVRAELSNRGLLLV